METRMDEVTKAAEDRHGVDEFDDDEVVEETPAAPLPGDEHAYADSWYQVLKGWATPADRDADA
jgi:hypothetical protein